MDPTTDLGLLLGLSGLCATAEEPAQVLDAAVPTLLALGAATSALVVRHDGDAPVAPHQAGVRLEAAAVDGVDDLLEQGSLVACPVPDAWSAHGIVRAAARRLPGHTGVLVLAWADDEAEAETGGAGLAIAVATVATALERIQASADLTDLRARVDNAQHLANMGDYDWHIPTDTNRWSDQLYRIYGHEPQSFNPSYEQFLSLIHPDDRERISGVHQAAYASGKPYEMIERIVRPDGEVRYLSSNGEVLMGEDGAPARMRGTCIDITDRVLAEREREHTAARFRGLVSSAPDAILVLDRAGHVLEANHRAHELLGGAAVGHHISELGDLDLQVGGQALAGTGLDGRELTLDVTVSQISEVDEKHLSALFLRDAADRLAGEAMAAKLGEAQLRRRQALEINDNVVQGLVAAAYGMDPDEHPVVASYLERTLAAARAMMDDLLEPLDGEDLRPGDLVRSAPAVIGGVAPEPREVEVGEPAAHHHTVLIVDDADDLRLLLRTRMEKVEGITVVGEASDGVGAIEQARALQPDLVLLDLAMPRMDGLEALPHIREAVPGVRVIVFSGFNQNTLADKAMQAGADRYVVKGGPIRELLELVQSVLQPS